MKCSVLFALAATATLATLPAYADGTEAQTLFDDAKQLASEGRWAEACPKLARSHQLDPRATTLFHLAECYRNTGRPASAWNAYLNSASAAAATGETKRASFATERAKALEATLPYLIITVSERPATVYTDGERVDEARWGMKIPLDPGEHAIVAEAPGKQRFTALVKVIDGATTVVAIPPLAEGQGARKAEADSAAPATKDAVPARPAGSPKPSVSATPRDNAGLRRWSVILAGVGLASAGGGAVLNLTSSDPDACKGACAAGTGMMIGGALVAATGLAFFLASLGEPSNASPHASTRALELSF